MVKEQRRARADSVLGNRMDDNLGFKRMKSSQSDNWRKVKHIIHKPDTKLCLIEVPKNVTIASTLVNIECLYVF